MKRILTTIVLAAFVLVWGEGFGGAKAADMPKKQYGEYSNKRTDAGDLFGGWWLGVEAGYGKGTVKPDVAIGDFKTDGFIGGGSLTYRQLVMPNTYLGLSTNLDYADLNDTQAFGGGVSASFKQNWFGSTTIQYGWTVLPTVLVYGEGGVAYGGSKATVNFPGGSISDRANSVGWTVGAGVDWAILNGWTAGVKYAYTDLGNAAYCGGIAGGVCIGTHGDGTDHRVLGTLKYNFGK